MKIKTQKLDKVTANKKKNLCFVQKPWTSLDRKRKTKKLTVTDRKAENKSFFAFWVGTVGVRSPHQSSHVRVKTKKPCLFKRTVYMLKTNSYILQGNEKMKKKGAIFLPKIFPAGCDFFAQNVSRGVRHAL
jgi:hypothetical protein